MRSLEKTLMLFLFSEMLMEVIETVVCTGGWVCRSQLHNPKEISTDNFTRDKKNRMRL
jgi:hypothetical protein